MGFRPTFLRFAVTTAAFAGTAVLSGILRGMLLHHRPVLRVIMLPRLAAGVAAVAQLPVNILKDLSAGEVVAFVVGQRNLQFD